MRDHFIKDHVLKKDDDVSKAINVSQSKIQQKLKSVLETRVALSNFLKKRTSIDNVIQKKQQESLVEQTKDDMQKFLM